MGATCAKSKSSRSAATTANSRAKPPAPTREPLTVHDPSAELHGLDVMGPSSIGMSEAQQTVGSRLESVMGSSYAVMGEPPLQVENLARMLDLAAEENKRVRDRDANFWQDEMSREGTSCPDLMEMATLAEWVFHADLAYEIDTGAMRSCLAQCGMVLMKHSGQEDADASAPGSPLSASIGGRGAVSPSSFGGASNKMAGTPYKYYIAFDPTRKLAVLAIRGAPRSVDNIGEALARGSEPLSASSTGWPLGSQQDYAHSGFAGPARTVVEDTADVVQHLLAAQGYLVVVTGHSLGAGVACCVAKLLSDQGVPIQCYTFATPPCLDRGAALACSGFMTSVVHNDDAVPRASLRNIKMMGSIFQAADDSRRSQGAAGKFDHQAILARGAASARLQPEQDLFVPGRVVFVYSNNDGQYKAAAKNGTLSTLRRIELTPNCLNDHLCSEYIKATVQVAGRLCGRHPSEFAPWKEPEAAPLAPLVQHTQSSSLSAQATSTIIQMPGTLQAALPAAAPMSTVATATAPSAVTTVATVAAPVTTVSRVVSTQYASAASPVVVSGVVSATGSTQPAAATSAAGTAPAAFTMTSAAPPQTVLTAPPAAPLSATAPAVTQAAPPQVAPVLAPPVTQASPPAAAPLQIVHQSVIQAPMAPQIAPAAVQLAPTTSMASQPQLGPASVSRSLESATPQQVELQAIQGRWFHKEKLSEGGVVVMGSDILWNDGHKTAVEAHGGGVFTTTWKGTTFQGQLQDGELRWNDGDVWVAETSAAVFGPAAAVRPAVIERAESDSAASESSAYTNSAASAVSATAVTVQRSLPVAAAGLAPNGLMPVPEEAAPSSLASVQKAPSYLITWDELQQDAAMGAAPQQLIPPGAVTGGVVQPTYRMHVGPDGATRYISDPLPVALARNPTAQFGLRSVDGKLIEAPVQVPVQQELVPLQRPDLLSRTVFPPGYQADYSSVQTTVTSVPAVAAVPAQ